jgi:iron complex outermembrane recepter protein
MLTLFLFAAATADSQVIEEVVVTALKRETTLQDTPLAVSAVSGATLVDRGIDNVSDLLRTTPGLGVLDQGAGQRRFIVRGVQSAGEAQTGLYYDEALVSSGSPGTTNDAGQRMPEIRLFDVERIEVLRGPQGTLYGSGSMGGTVRVLFNKPTNEYQTQAHAAVETMAEGATGYEADGMINMPFGDQLAARVVAYHHEHGGYIDNLRLGIDDINDEEASGGRVLLRYQPNEKLTVDLAAHVQREDAAVSVWEHTVGEYQSRTATQLPVKDDFELYNLTLKWDLGFATLTGVGSFFERDLLVTIDGTRFLQGILPQLPPPLRPPFVESVLHQPQDIEDRSYELRLGSNGSGPLAWTLGAYFEQRDAFTSSQHVKTDPITGLRVVPTVFAFHRDIRDVLEQRAVFGELSYDIMPALTLTLGGRYFDYDKEVTGRMLVPFAPFGFLTTTGPTTSRSDEDGFVSKVGLAYRFGEHVLAYAQANQGFRPGGVNQVPGLDQTLAPYEADSTWNYELGLKSRWFDEQLQLNLAAFRIDWDDMQVTGVSRTNAAVRFIANAGAARIDGIELEATAAPLAGLQIALSGAYLDARLRENQSNADLTAPGLKDDRIPNVPEYSAALALEYGRPLGAALHGSMRTDVTYVGETTSEFRPTSAFFERIDAYTLTNVRLRLADDDTTWNLDLYVDNLFDELAIGRVLSSPFGFDLTLSSPPRTIGIAAGMKW